MSTNFSKKTKNRREKPKNSLEIKSFDPLTKNQSKVFESFDSGKNLFIHGCPGTGKSFISLYLSLEDIMNNNNYDKVVIFRSAVPTRDQGFMPGNQKEKNSYYEEPYRKICSQLFGRDDAYDLLKHKNIIEFSSTGFLRSLTFDNTIMILDEAQNCDYNELKTVITRVGDNTKLIVCGDSLQDDLTSERYNERSGLEKMMKILQRMKSIDFHEMSSEDIVRSGFVKEFIIKEMEVDRQEKKLNGKSHKGRETEDIETEEFYKLFNELEMFQA